MRLIFLLMVPILFSACATSPARQDAATPVVAQKTLSQPICITGKDGALTREDKAALADFLAPVPPLAIDRVQLSSRFCCKGDKARLEAVRKALVEQGIPRDVIWYVQKPELPKRADQITVTYSEGVALACNNWSANATINYANAPMPNLGCAIAHNLAHSVARPADVAGTSGQAAMDTDRNLVVIKGYKENAPVELSDPSTTTTTGGS